ncbi:MAG: NAD(P)H-dependent oxidoreductase subunit E [Tepidisphaerales bacterium]
MVATAATQGSSASFDLHPLEQILEEFKGRKDAVIPILQRAQDVYGYLPREIIYHISKRTRIPVSRLFGVATFYAQFRLTRRGRHLIRLCDGTACHVRGAKKALDSMEKAMSLKPGQTSPDYKYTLEIVYCLGSCGLAPVALVDDKVVGRLSPDALVDRLGKME